jgi:hypothetical protein
VCMCVCVCVFVCVRVSETIAIQTPESKDARHDHFFSLAGSRFVLSITI